MSRWILELGAASALLSLSVSCLGENPNNTMAGVPLPMGDVCIAPNSTVLQERFACPEGTGGLDRVCRFSFGSTNGGVLLADDTLDVREHVGMAEEYCFNVWAYSEGTAEIHVYDENGNYHELGTVVVSSRCRDSSYCIL